MADITTGRTQPGSQLIIAGEDIPFGAYQAIYHSLTKKVERRFKAFKDAYVITFADFENLHSRLMQAIRQYNVRSCRCQVTHQLRDDTSREHSSFEKFRNSDLLTRSHTTRITYELDFLIILPPEIPEASEIPQRYKLTMHIEQESIDDTKDRPLFLRALRRERDISLNIEFADYAVSQSLYAIAEGWVNTLPVKSRGRFYKVMRYIEKPVRFYLSGFVRAATLFSGCFALVTADTIRAGFIIVLFFTAISMVLSTIVDAFLERVYDNLDAIMEFTEIHATVGDQDRIEDLDRKSKATSKAMSVLMLGVFLSMIVSLASSYIYDAAKYW